MKFLILILLSLNLFALEITISSSLSQKEILDIEKNAFNITSNKYKSLVWKDSFNSLMWEDDEREITKLSFEEASEYCEKLNLKSFKDWRLPTVDELSSLIDYTHSIPKARDGLKYISNVAYISSTKYHKQKWNTQAISSVYLDSGSVDYYLDSLGHLISVRCVRKYLDKE